MSRLIDPILEELTREAETTRRVLDRVPDEKLSWRPHEKSKTLGELAWHVAAIPRRIAVMAQGEEADVLKIPPSPMPATSAGIADGFTDGVAEARDLLSKLDDESLSKTFVMRRGEIKMISRPKLEFLRTVMLNHSYHHRGQLAVYLRLIGVPVPPIYGPTADEM